MITRSIKDRVIQQAISQVLMPIFEPGFSDNSFGFRPGRNGHQAVKQVQRIIKEGRRFAVDVDLQIFRSPESRSVDDAPER
ncbi:reverse transcriptase domain-containing protein [Exilibacterium tricleocarpae]|uniref:reverse transcriptase domain-containing protein n=1 Tax=Exilibacterium tricleocarpae TaxID=2591008 RepID=UPI001FE6A50B|nr:reverse transcriptase domain-containing protein [Exilibacterium tricleocarpae]